MDITLIPQGQLDRVLSQDICDIDYDFLGFTDIYEHLAAVIPLHWTVVDLGRAYSPQAFLFRNHAAYVGVDLDLHGQPTERFNTTHFIMSINEFVARHISDFDLNTTFAICSYVPSWGGDNMKLVRESFRNVFTYYPAGGHEPIIKCLDGDDQ